MSSHPQTLTKEIDLELLPNLALFFMQMEKLKLSRVKLCPVLCREEKFLKNKAQFFNFIGQQYSLGVCYKWRFCVSNPRVFDTWDPKLGFNKNPG